MAFSAGISKGSTNLNSNELQDFWTEKESESSSDSVTQNSGSKNTSTSNTVNSGSVNTSTTKTGPSTNTTVQSGSTSLVENSGSINTSQLMLSQEAVDYMTTQILAGTQGLAAVSSGQKTAGGYNSSANQLLVNDLLARTAGEVASRSAVTKQVIGGSTSLTTNSGSTVTQNIGATESNTIQNIGGSTSVTNGEQIIGGSTSSVSTVQKMVESMLGQTEIVKEAQEKKNEKKASGGWIVCTELLKQKRMPNKWYKHGLKVFNTYTAQDKKGYYYWAVPAVAHLKAHPTSLLSKVLEVVMNARAEYLAAEVGVDGARKTAFGYVIKHGLFIVCWTLARTLARNYGAPKKEGGYYAS